jgi:hypothetical protein
MAHAQMPVAATALDVKTPAAAWHDKPSYAVIARDRARHRACELDGAAGQVLELL